MRKLTIAISVIISMIFIPSAINGLEVKGVHCYPPEPTTEEEVILFALLEGGENGFPPSLRMNLSSNYTSMEPENEMGSDQGNGTIYKAEFVPKIPGDNNITIEILMNDSWVEIWSGSIYIEESENKGSSDDIFGLPRWWCAASVLFATILLIFLTWSYFKGKKLQKNNIEKTGALRIYCSECGKPISNDSEECPHCGSSLKGEEYICGKCKSPVSGDEKLCKVCGTKLTSIVNYSSNGNRVIKSIDSKRPKREDRELKEKITCKKCDCVYMGSEKSCPECGTKN